MKLFIAGFVLSLLGSIPPGLISLTVAYTAIRNSFEAALVLAAGAASAEFFQAWGAVALADWFLSHPAIEMGFHWAAMVVFALLGCYMLFFAKAPKTPKSLPQVSMSRQFATGIMLSVFNLLALPYWFTYCGWLRMEGWWEEGLFNTLIFSLGVTFGTMAALASYAWLGIRIVERSSDLAKRAKQFIGLLFLGLGLKILLELLFSKS